MDEPSFPRTFACEWVKYLKRQGHQVKQIRRAFDVVVSRNGRGIRYRWVLVVGPAMDHENIQRQVRLGREANEQVYVVVKFHRPVSKVIVIPAVKVAMMRLIKSNKGGIPWGR